MNSAGSSVEIVAESLRKVIFRRRKRRQLTPEQRVAVIERYEQNASVRSLAVEFKCGRTQIKSILRNRNLHLDVYARSRRDHAQLERTPQADSILEVVLYEWIKRARCYGVNISDDSLFSFAREIADHFSIEDLRLDHHWLATFKEAYKLTEADLLGPAVDEIFLGEQKPLSINLIIDDIRQRHGIGNIPTNGSSAEIQTHEEESGSAEDNCIHFDKDGFDVYMQPSPLQQEEDSGVQVEAEELDRVEPSEADVSVVKEIQSYREALNHLGPLEQFALMKENIRAIGLINQLENLFRDQMEENT